MLFPYLAFSVIVTWLQPPLANKAPNFNFPQFYFQSTQFQFPPKNLVSKLQISISSEILNFLSNRFRFPSKSFNFKRCRFQFPTNLLISERADFGFPQKLSFFKVTDFIFLQNFQFPKVQISVPSKLFNVFKIKSQVVFLRFMPNTFTDLSEECSKEGVVTRSLKQSLPNISSLSLSTSSSLKILLEYF